MAVRRHFHHCELSGVPNYGAMLGLRIHSLSLPLSAAATNRQLMCALTSRPQHVLRGSHGIRDQVPGDWWTRFCNGCFEVYLFLIKVIMFC